MIHRILERASLFAAGAVLLLSAVVATGAPKAGESTHGYTVLSPISHDNLTIFPVVVKGDGPLPDTLHFLTLDEGVRSGKVVVTEIDKLAGLVRGRMRPLRGGAEVNRLVLVNNSDDPVILLAGEIVTGGKQDRIVAKDRIVPAHSDPIDLGVFCVEPGRWTEASSSFGTQSSMMAQPSVRKRAMANRDQQEVWSEVRRSSVAMAAASPGVAEVVAGTSSYARVMGSRAAEQEVDAVALPLEQSYEGMIRELRVRRAVGVVAAVNGRIVWADMFANTSLLEKYWPKLIRSYAAEALTRKSGAEPEKVDVEAAGEFLDRLEGKREVSDTEPGVYRHTEMIGNNFTVFRLTSLLPGTGFTVHLAKMAGAIEVRPRPVYDGVPRTPDFLRRE